MSQSEGCEKTDASGEFFTVGAPLHAVRAGYIKRRADDLLYETLAAGRYAHVLAPDRSGKSSLISATAARLENNGAKVAVLDLAQIGERDGGSDSGRWYYSVAYRLLRQLRIRFDLQAWWQDKSVLGSRQRLVEFYSEVVLSHIAERVVIFVDELQCIEERPYADQLLASIRAAHNARTTDPDFTRLTFALCGECDPLNLVEETELSPFNVTQQVLLEDFSRRDIDLFATELNVGSANAALALDRIFYWTAGQPYLTQKLARAIAREAPQQNVEDEVDRIAVHQLAGRAALHSEPHMSHIHRRLVSDSGDCEALLNLYGKLRKGIEVPADLGSMTQRRLMAVGLVVIDPDGNLAVRNRLFGAVFTTRWANENLPTKLKVPLLVAAGLFVFALIPLWYTQWLPGPYLQVLSDESVAIEAAESAYQNLASFPGHADTALNLYRRHLELRATAAASVQEIHELSARLAALPGTGGLAAEIEAGFWDRRATAALRSEQRDAAIVATLQSLVLTTPTRRQRAVALIAEDYPLLQATLPEHTTGTTVFDDRGMVLTNATGSTLSQWTWAPQGLQQREPWTITALEVTPLVRRVIVDQDDSVRRIGLTLNISHARHADLRIKVIAPSGRTVEINTGRERASSGDDIQIPAAQLSDLIGESLGGTWSISVRDEAPGVAGQLVGWNLKLNSQGVVEHFQRGLNIPDPVERATENLWFDRSGRFAVARASQSDSARIWNLAFAEPARAIAVSERESLIGLDASARLLITATQDSVYVWDTANGDKVRSLPVGAASRSATLTADGRKLFVVHRGDVETRLELWSLETGAVTEKIVVAGSPAHVSIDASGSRVAVADFDRSVRIWDFASSEQLAQLDLAMQPGSIELSADGRSLGALYANFGISVWNIDRPERPLLERRGSGNWQFAFSASGTLIAVGRPTTGFQVFSTQTGWSAGPAFGLRTDQSETDLLRFSSDEQMLLTGAATRLPRLWKLPAMPADVAVPLAHSAWNPTANYVFSVTADAGMVAVGDRDGHVHVLDSAMTPEELIAAADDVSFLGHTSAVRMLATSTDSRFAASVDSSNSLRVWRLDTGEPFPWVASIRGEPVSSLEFSPDTDRLALLSGSVVSIVDTRTGTTNASFDVTDPIGDIGFVDSKRLYIGTVKGALQLLQRDGDGVWGLRQVWQGDAGVRLLKGSPRGDYLIVVDDTNLARQIVLSDGSIARGSLQLPSAVEDIVFDPQGVQAWFRTSRWAHAVTVSASGLIWNNAVLSRPALPGASIVFRQNPATGAHVAVLPVARNGFLEILNVIGSDISGLIGSHDALLRDWQSRISADHPAAYEPESPD